MAAIAYGKDVAILPDDAEQQLQDILTEHPLRDYPEGALVATFSSEDLQDPTAHSIRDPREILANPYPWNVRLSEFPPEEGQRCKW